MGRLSRIAVAFCAAGLVLVPVGCTPDEPGASPSPMPSAPSASPSESEEERAARERGEHAIDVYEKADDELVRLLKAGEGEPSEEFRRHAAGSYLDAATDLLQQLAADGVHVEGELKRLDVRVLGTPGAERVRILSCEDASASRYVDSDGEAVSEGKFSVQTVEVELVDDGNWMVTFVESKGHDSLNETECADAV